MARVKKRGEGLSKPVSFRLTHADHAEYERKVRESGLTASDFFREVVLTNRTKIVARPKMTVDIRRLLFLFGAISNNMNQLARQANAQHMAGELSEKTFESILFNLQMIQRHLKGVVGDVD